MKVTFMKGLEEVSQKQSNVKAMFLWSSVK
jgi:hypothetical protein